MHRGNPTQDFQKIDEGISKRKKLLWEENKMMMNSKMSKKLDVLRMFLLFAGIFYWNGCASQEPASGSDATGMAPSLGKSELLFRVQVSDTGLQAQWLAEGNELTDFMEAKLPCELHDPPLRFGPIEQADAKRDTPVDAAVSDFSAFKADEDQWILENFSPEQRPDVESLLNRPDIRRRNKKIFDSRDYVYITGEAEYEGYALVFVQGEKGEPVRPLAFKKISGGTAWLRTNELSDDGIFDIVFSALSNGEVRLAE